MDYSLTATMFSFRLAFPLHMCNFHLVQNVGLTFLSGTHLFLKDEDIYNILSCKSLEELHSCFREGK